MAGFSGQRNRRQPETRTKANATASHPTIPLPQRHCGIVLEINAPAGQTHWLGICLGYQLLFDASEESPGVAGLGLVRGTVRRFPASPGVKIPHMGWNSVVPRQPAAAQWSGLGAEPYFYFVHSYFPVPDDDYVIAAETTYGGTPFAAAIERPALLACQFHPEKSQDAGLRLIRNFFGR